MEIKSGDKLVHHRSLKFLSAIWEIILGMQDGLVSVVGAITGIAIGSHDKFTVILSGTVMIAVESISMGIAAYNSSKSETGVNALKLAEEKFQLKNQPLKEKEELKEMYVRDGWPGTIASQMADTAARDESLMLKEQSLRELKIFESQSTASAFRSGLFMFAAFVVGGIVPLSPYFVLPVSTALYLSIAAGLIGLFLLGAVTSRYSIDSWIKSGLRIFLLGGAALLVGLAAGWLVEQLALGAGPA